MIASRAKEGRLALLATSEVEPFLGSKPYFGQGPGEGEVAAVDLPILEAARFRGAPIVFLGLSEAQANDYRQSTSPGQLAKTLIGTPFFSIDLTEISQTELDRLLQTSTAGTDGFALSFAEPRGATRGMSEFDAAIFAEARSMVDWNLRNKVWVGWHHMVVSRVSSLIHYLLSSVLPVVRPYTLCGVDGRFRAQAFYRHLKIRPGSLVPHSLSLLFRVIGCPNLFLAQERIT